MNAPAPPFVRRLLVGLYRLEAGVSIAAFAVITGALFADLVGRDVFGHGIFVAQRLSVYCMIVAAMLGFALSVGWGAHMGFEFADRLAPARWNATMNRVADAVSCGACLCLAWWSVAFVADAWRTQARGMSLEVLLWPIQSVLVWAFCSSASRYAAYAAWPDLRHDQAPAAAGVPSGATDTP